MSLWRNCTCIQAYRVKVELQKWFPVETLLLSGRPCTGQQSTFSWDCWDVGIFWRLVYLGWRVWPNSIAGSTKKWNPTLGLGFCSKSRLPKRVSNFPLVIMVEFNWTRRIQTQEVSCEGRRQRFSTHFFQLLHTFIEIQIFASPQSQIHGQKINFEPLWHSLRAKQAIKKIITLLIWLKNITL